MVTETVIGKIDSVSGRTRDFIYDLVFTSERIIVVTIKHPKDLLQIQSLDFGSFIWGNWREKRKEQEEQYQLSIQRRESIDKLTPAELLKNTQMNFEIKYNLINSAEIKRGLLETHLKFNLDRPGMSRQRCIFVIKKRDIPAVKAILEKVLKSKIQQ